MKSGIVSGSQNTEPPQSGQKEKVALLPLSPARV
jgi:hypothetical protein